MASPQFTIIIPVYNAAQFIYPLMHQLQDQTLQDFEIIYINDASPDTSADIINSLAEMDARIRVFHHKINQGQGAARNTGLDHARGEYIIYIDADDSVPNNYLDSLMRGIEKYNADLVICNSISIYPDRNVRHNIFIDNPDLPELLLTGEEVLQRYFHIYKNDLRIPVEPWGRIIRRSLIEMHNLRFPNTLHEDVVMTYSELLFSQKVLLLNEYLYYYNQRNSICITSEKKRQYLKEFPAIFIGFRDILITNELYECNKKWLSRFYFGFLSGVYENFSKNEDLSQDMREGVRCYRDLFPDPLIEGSEAFISNKLLNFKLEMERYNLSDIFTLFIEVHPEIHPLLRKNLLYYGKYSLNLFLRYRTIQNLYCRMIINPKSEEKRLYIIYLSVLYKRLKR